MVKKRRKAPKKKLVKKSAAKRRPAKKRVSKKRLTTRKKIKQKIIGIVTHYFPKVRAAVVKIKTPLSTGDTIKIKGHTTDFTQTITSMQIDHVPIAAAKKGDEIGLLVNSRVREHDILIKP